MRGIAPDRIRRVYKLLFIYYNIQPYAFFHKNVSENTLEYIRWKHAEVKLLYGYVGESAKEEGENYLYTPDKTAVKKEGDKGFSSRTQGKIAGVVEGLNRHKSCNYEKKVGSKVLDGVRCVVNLREEGREAYHHKGYKNNYQHRKLNKSVKNGQ